MRLYNIDSTTKEGTWGSFIMHPSRPSGASPEAIGLSLDFGFSLGLKRIILDVRKDNIKAQRLYEYCGFKKYAETEIDYLYEIFPV